MPSTSTPTKPGKGNAAQSSPSTSARTSAKVRRLPLPPLHPTDSQPHTEFRQCLIYDSNSPTARLIGVEYMVPRHVYETLDPEEQKLWHSHEFEVKSGMLILPTPTSHGTHGDRWEKLETEAMKEVIGLYGKTWHFWQLDKGHELPLGRPVLMGSLTESNQMDVDEALQGRNGRFDVDHREKAKVREQIKEPGIHPNADSWWTEARQHNLGQYA